jgi:hypothetical protein
MREMLGVMLLDGPVPVVEEVVVLVVLVLLDLLLRQVMVVQD